MTAFEVKHQFLTVNTRIA